MFVTKYEVYLNRIDSFFTSRLKNQSVEIHCTDRRWREWAYVLICITFRRKIFELL